MSISRRGVMWTVGALLGIAVAVALSWSMSRLAGQRIGLSSVPPSVAGTLAPSGGQAPGAGAGRRATPAGAAAAAPPAPGSRTGGGDDGGDGGSTGSGGPAAQADD